MWKYTDMTRPIATVDVSIEEPPAEMKGRGIPITVVTPTVLPIFKTQWAINYANTPTHINLPSISDALMPFVSILRHKSASKTTIVMHPINPSVCPA